MAAEQVVFKARQNFEEFAPADEPPQELLRSIIDESHTVIKLTRFTSEQDPHTTACVLLFHAGRVDWAHCGDSRIYHFRGDKLVSRSFDHSYVNEMVKQGFLTPEQAEQHPQKNVLLGCWSGRGRHRLGGTCAGRNVFSSVPTASGPLFRCRTGVLSPSAPQRRNSSSGARDRANGHGDNCSLVIVKLVEKKAEKKPAAAVPPGSPPPKA